MLKFTLWEVCAVKRKILIGMILLSLVASLVVMIGRHQIEQASPDVEVVLDWNSLEELHKETKQPMTSLLQTFKDAGVTSVAIYDKKLSDYVKEKQLVMLNGQDLIGQYFLDGYANPVIKGLFGDSIDIESLILIFQDKNTYNELYTLIDRLPGDYITGRVEDSEKNLYVIEIKNGETEILDIPLGFNDEEIKLIREAGLKLVPRFSDTKERLTILPDILQNIESKIEISEIIFAGNIVIGYPNRLKETADVFSNYTIGMIEPFLGYQDGIKELAVLKDFEIVRVHSFQQKEMDKYSYEKVLDRYIRAIKERNVRALYLRPFLKAKNQISPLKLNQLLLEDLQKNLQKSGYSFGSARPFPTWSTEIVWIVIISLGVLAASLLLLSHFLSLPDWLDYGLLVIGGLGTFVIAYKGYVLLTREMLALLAAVVLPSLAVIEGYQHAIKKIGKDRNEIIRVSLIFAKTIGITFIGVLFVIGLMSDLRYLYQINQFRGIKFSFVLPLLIIVLYYIKDLFLAVGVAGPVGMLKKGFQLLNQPVRYSHVVLLGLLGVLGILYIGRTGNFPILPIPAWELKLRDFLEDILVFRPRLKEFGIGHPFMLMALYYAMKNKGKLLLPLLLLGSIGQISLINTFAHIHTPVMVSIIRVFWGVILGILLGLILIQIYQVVVKSLRKLRRFVYE